MSDYFTSDRFNNSKERIKQAFDYEIHDFSKVPIVIQAKSYWLTGHDPDDVPSDYYTNPKAMMDFQLEGIEEHLEKIDDDYIPYLMPWYGVSLIPGVFGSTVRFPEKQDPWCSDFGIKDVKSIKDLGIPDLEANPLTRKVLDTITYFKQKSSYPVGVTDMQSTLDCISLIVGYENLFYWMKDDPAVVDRLVSIVNDTLIEWVKLQKKYIGEDLDSANGLINIRPPDGVGIWFSDDDAVILSPDLYKRFIMDKYSKSFSSFGSAMIHWCGDANHQLENITNIKGLGAVHNLFLSDIKSAVKLQRSLKTKKVVLVAGDIIPVEEELDDYLNSIKDNLDPEGLVLNFIIAKKLGLKNGRYVETTRDIMENAQRILTFFRG